METSLGAVARLKDLERHTPKEDQDQDVATWKHDLPQKGRIVFQNVEAKYKYAILDII
jgi:hypothetical protein